MEAITRNERRFVAVKARISRIAIIYTKFQYSSV
jgi:hypothetical protein